MLEMLKDLLGFLRGRRKWWLLPVILILLVLISGSAVAPFIYTFF